MALARPPQVILSANVAHYYYTALALDRAGYLKQFITAIAISRKHAPLIDHLPLFVRARLRPRQYREIAPEAIKSLWLPELLQRGLPKLKLASRERGDFINNYLYDWGACLFVNECDVFHFVSSVGLYSARRAKRHGSIIVCDERTEHPDFQRHILEEECARLCLTGQLPGSLYDRKIKAEYDIADFIIVPSSYAKDTFVQAGFREDKIFIVPYGVDLSIFHEGPRVSIGASSMLASPQPSFRVLYVGQVILRKGIHYLIEAFKDLYLPGAELLIVGTIDPMMEGLIQERVRGQDNIKLIGPVPKTALHRYYAHCSVLVLPSLADSFGLVSLEAMACGVPVIVTQNCGSKEVVRDGLDGFVVPIRDVQSLKAKLRFLYDHPDQSQEMGRSASRRVQQFTWEAYGKRLIEVYDQMLAAEVKP